MLDKTYIFNKALTDYQPIKLTIMKIKLIFVLALAVCSAEFSFAQYVPDTLKAVKTETAPEIDGTIDAVWGNAQFVEISYWGDDPVPTSDDFTATYKVLWDDQFLYFLGVAVDDIVTDKAGIAAQSAPDWETDCFEIYWAPSNTQLPDMTEMIQVRLAYANAANEDASSNVVNGWSEDGFTVSNFVTGARALSDNGWVAEGKFDLAALADAVKATNPDFEIGDGSVLGINIMAGDNDNTSLRENVGSWIDGMHYNEADSSGVLKLLPLGENVAVKRVNQANLNFYPNPVTRELHFTSGSKIETVEIVNLLGANVLKAQNVNNQINVSQLKPGVYLVNYYSDGVLVASHKMLKK